ncbi:MAG: hypothetical protein AB3N64_03720 [Puniceicoccaceae bacterium]
MSRLLPFLMVTLFLASSTFATIPIFSPTTEWNPITYPGVTSDYPSDTQASSLDLDLVGDVTHAAFYTRFDATPSPQAPEGEVGYRLRMAGNQSPATFAGQAWIGADVNSDGALDLFVGANNNTVSINFAGADSNTSPNTTSIDSTPFWSASVSATNFSWTENNSSLDPDGTNFDIDNGGETDYFLTFIVPFDQLAAAVNSLSLGFTFDNTSPLAYIAATATQGQTLNADLNGVNGTAGTLSWTELDAISPEVGIDGEPAVPEPGLTALIVALAGGFFLFVQKRR